MSVDSSTIFGSPPNNATRAACFLCAGSTVLYAVPTFASATVTICAIANPTSALSKLNRRLRSTRKTRPSSGLATCYRPSNTRPRVFTVKMAVRDAPHFDAHVARIRHKISIREAYMSRRRITSLIVLVSLIGICLGARMGIRAATLSPALQCDLGQYKASPGLTAALDQNLLVISWTGQGGAELRARYVIEGSQPVIRDLVVRKPGGVWMVLGENLSPEYDVVSGIRRLPNDQGGALQRQGIPITQEVIDKNRWYAFWDAPLLVPGTPQPAAGRGGQTVT